MAVDLGGGGKRGSAQKGGSVWESRVKLDEVKGGITALIGTDGNGNTKNGGGAGNGISERVSGKAVDRVSPPGGGGKRKSWKSDSSERSPLRIARQRSDLDHKLKELGGGSPQGIKPSPGRSLRLRKEISDLGKVESEDRADETFSGNSKLRAKEQLVKTKSAVETIVEKFDDKPEIEHQNSRSEEEVASGRKEEKNLTVTAQIRAPFEETGIVDPEVSDQFQGKSEEKKQLRSHKWNTSSEKENQATFHSSSAKTRPISSNFDEIQRTSRLQTYVDLIMWRDVSKSTFVFGTGTFAIISSSFTTSPNISTISVVSYLGLLYLSASFLFRSLNTRDSANVNRKRQERVVGEEDAIWIAKQVLPFVNEFLLKLRALFSGDPATTMKLAALLFALAQVGSSITIWKMAKLGFIGVFTVPKICSSYSFQLSALGRFWMRRFHDAWESCTQKKVVAFAVFAFVWNSMSVVARMFAVFMLFVAFKGYQQSVIFGDELSEQRGSEKSCVGIRSSTDVTLNQAREVVKRR